MRSIEIRLRNSNYGWGISALLTTRPPVLPSGGNHFSRSWLFGAVAQLIYFNLYIYKIIIPSDCLKWYDDVRFEEFFYIISPWRYSSEEPWPTEVIAARWEYRGRVLWLSKCYPSTLISVFLTGFWLLLISSSYPFVLTRLGGPLPDPILPEKFLGYSRESNPGQLGWQSDVQKLLYQTGGHHTIIRYFIYNFYLTTTRYVLLLRLETVVVLRRFLRPEDKCGLNYLTYIILLRKPGKPQLGNSPYRKSNQDPLKEKEERYLLVTANGYVLCMFGMIDY